MNSAPKQTYATILHELAYGGVDAFIQKYVLESATKKRSRIDKSRIDKGEGLELTESEKGKLRVVLRKIEDVAGTISSTQKATMQENAELSLALMKQFNELGYRYKLSPHVNKTTGELTDPKDQHRDLLNDKTLIAPTEQKMLASPAAQLLSNAVLVLNIDVVDAQARIAVKKWNHRVHRNWRLTRNEVLSTATDYFKQIIFKYDADYGVKVNTFLTGGFQRFFMRFLHNKYDKNEMTFDDDRDGNSWAFSIPSRTDDDSERREAVASWAERVKKDWHSILDDREISILTMRLSDGPQEPLTLKEVAAAFGLSKERVRQLEAGALDKLREQIKTLPESYHGL